MYLILCIPLYASWSMQPFYVHVSCALFPSLVLWHWFISITFHSIRLILYFSCYAYHYMHLIICISSYKSQQMHLCISTYIRVRKSKSKTKPEETWYYTEHPRRKIQNNTLKAKMQPTPEYQSNLFQDYSSGFVYQLLYK